jgi:anti-sigma regulatory factor (Ser/Thr protein kinase)
MTFSVPNDPRVDTQPRAGPADDAARGALLKARDDLLEGYASRSLADLGASAVTVYFLEPGGNALRAAVVAVRPLGVGSLEWIPLGDESYASALAYRTGKLETAYSSEEIGRHPELAVFAPFPFTVSSVPLKAPSGRHGVVAAYWPTARHRLTAEQERYLYDLADTITRDLVGLAAQGAPMIASTAPRVVSGPETQEADPLFQEGASAPLLYHLQKLTVSLNQVFHVKDAARLVIQRLTSGFSARAVAITLLEGDRLRVVGAFGCQKEFLRALNGRALSEASPETDAIVSREQVVLDSAGMSEVRSADLPGRGAYTWAVLPLVSGGRAVGSCSLGFRPGEAGPLVQPVVLTALATLLSQTLSRTQLNEAQHLLASRLQQALLPRTLPQMSGVQTTTRYVASNRGVELGGDWYDLVSLPDGGIGAVVGDVQGHNVNAAVIMGQLRSAVRAYATEGHDPGTVLSRTNRLLVELDTDRFATCCLVWLMPDTGIAKIVSAGHHVPVIRTPGGRRLAEHVDVGIPLGIEREAYYKTTDVRLEAESLIVLYTDGMAGGRPGSGETEDVILAELARNSGGELETLGDRLISSAPTGVHRADDAALLLIRYEGRGEESQRSVRRLAVNRRDMQGVRRTRTFLRQWLHTWELAPMSETMELLGSEVVTNALVHGDSDVDIHVRRYPDRIRVEVRDTDPSPAVPVFLSASEEEAEGGRGLVIVSALASAWGNSPSGRGKTVWFEIAVPAEGEETAAPDVT